MSLITNSITAILRLFGAEPARTKEALSMRATLMRASLWVLIGAGISESALAILLPEYAVHCLLLGTVSLLGALGIHGLDRKGRINVGAVLLPLLFYLILTVEAMTAGGVSAPAFHAYSIFVIFAMFIFGRRAGIAMAVVVALTGAVMAYLEAAHLMPAPLVHHTVLSRYLGELVVLLVLVMLVAQFSRHLHRSLEQALIEMEERKRTHQKIEQQAALLDLAHDAIVVFNLQGIVTYWNRGAAALYGWKEREAVGRSVREILYGDVYSSEYQEAHALVVKNGEWSGELEQVEKNGGRVLADSRWTLISDNEGPDQSILSINTDITEKKSLQSQLLRSQRLESLGTLAGGIAHDLNNILTPILMSVELLRTKAEGREVQKTLATLETSAVRGADIIKQLLTFARGLKGEFIHLQPRHLIKELERLLASTFPKSIQIDVVSSLDVWSIDGDPTQIHQVLLNICINARDAMENGGSMTITVENVEIDEVYSKMHLSAVPGKYVCISIADTGTGIPQGIVDKIFDPFFTTKEIGKGTGLGLSTVLTIVKNHSGFINVYSEPGKGTEFKVFFPATGDLSSDGRGMPPRCQMRGNNELILFIEDEENIRTIAKEVLSAKGYRMLSARNGIDGLSLYAQHRSEIAVVITDMMMPYLDGVSTIRAMKQMDGQIKIIVISGLLAGNKQAELTELGITHQIHKPFTSQKLLQTVEEILQGERLGTEVFR